MMSERDTQDTASAQATQATKSRMRFATPATAQVGDYLLARYRNPLGPDTYRPERVVRATAASFWIERLPTDPIRRAKAPDFVDAPEAECYALLQHYYAWMRLHKALATLAKVDAAKLAPLPTAALEALTLQATALQGALATAPLAPPPAPLTNSP